MEIRSFWLMESALHRHLWSKSIGHIGSLGHMEIELTFVTTNGLSVWLISLPKILPDPNPCVYFDIKIGLKHVGRIWIELFKDITPKTAENSGHYAQGSMAWAHLDIPSGTRKAHSFAPYQILYFRYYLLMYDSQLEKGTALTVCSESTA